MPDSKLQQLLCGGLFALASMPALHNAHAQDYPAKPLRWLVGTAVGGGNDLLARLVAEKLSGKLGRRVVVDNRTGASSQIAMELAAKSAPDGYTLYLISATATINQAFQRAGRSVDVLRDFDGITRMTSQSNILLVPVTSSVRSVNDLITYAKSRPKGLTYGSSGGGSSSYLSAELFNHMAKVRTNHIPYKGGVPVLIDLIGGQLDFTFGLYSSTQAHVNSGKLHAVAVTGKNRVSLLPNVPTVDESGLPGYEVVGWYGAVVPVGTPKAVIKLLNTQIIEIMQMPDVRDRIRQDAAEVSSLSSEEFARYLKEDIAKWTKLVKDAGLRIDE